MLEAALRSRAATMTGLALALLGIPVIVLGYNLLVPSPASIGPMLLREAAIFALVAALLLIVTRWEGLRLRSIGLSSATPGKTLLWGGLGFVALGLGHRRRASRIASLWAFLWLGRREIRSAALGHGADRAARGCRRGNLLSRLCHRKAAGTDRQSLDRGAAAAHLLRGVPLRRGPAGMGIALLLGAILTALYLWKRNLAANIIAHFLIDFLPNVLLPLLSGE